MENVKIVVQPRELTGSRAARRLRNEGLIPGVLYGHGSEATLFAVEPHVMREALATGAGSHAVLEVTVDGQTGNHKAIVKEITVHKTKHVATHIDLQEIRLDETIETLVAVRFEGEPVGVKAGGVLEETLREVTVKGVVTAIPEHLIVTIDELDINDTARVADLQVPDGITVVDDPEQALCSVLPPRSAEEEEVVEGAEGAEPEVIGDEGAGD